MNTNMKMANAPVAGVKAQQSMNGVVGIDTSSLESNQKNGSNDYKKELFKEFVSVLGACVSLYFSYWLFKLKTKEKTEAVKDVYKYKCDMDIEKAQAIHNIKTQGNEVDSQNTTQEEEESKWEDFNDAVYKHADEVYDWLVGNVINKGGTHLIIGAKSIGKTILVTTIADAISKGKEYRIFVEDETVPCCQPPQKVYLYDLEMQYSDLKKRNGKHGYTFTNIIRCAHRSFTVESWLRNVKKVVDGLTGDATIILDNITRLESDITQPIYGRKLFDGIKSLKEEAKERGVVVTFILIAHTTNNRNDNDPITLKDAACADALTTGLDSITVIGPTKDPNKSLFKALCLRNAPKPSEVIILESKDYPFLRLDIIGIDKEENVRPTKNSPTKSETLRHPDGKSTDPEIRKGWPLSKAMEVEEASKTGSQRKVAELYGLSAATIGNVLKDLKKYREMNQQEPSKE